MNVTSTPDGDAPSGHPVGTVIGGHDGVQAGHGPAPQSRAGGRDRRGALTSDRLALGTFWVAWLAAFPILLRAGRRKWFGLDEWEFLANRELTDLSSLFEPHNEHWSTVPIVLYRLTFSVFALNRYWPYLLLAISAHLAVAALLRVVMRRAGVGPWLASAGAILFAYLGAGRENFASGFQVSFGLAVAFGLVSLLLTDRDSRRITRRDVVAIGFGLLALMSAGVGVFMVMAVGLATLLRRGWRVACFHSVPLGVIYLVWYAFSSPDSGAASGRATHVGGMTYEFLADTLRGIAGGGIPAAVLMLLVLAGAAIGLSDGTSRLRHDWAVPAGMLVTAVAFSGATAYGRRAFATTWQVTTAGRYVHIVAALVLPAIVVCVATVAARQKALLAVAAVVFAVGFVSNATSLEPAGEEVYVLGDEQAWVARADAVVEWNVPDDVLLTADLVGVRWGVPAGWLRDQRLNGGIPRLDDIPADVRQRAVMSVLFVAVRPVEPEEGGGCEEIGPGPVVLRRGQTAQVPTSNARLKWLDGDEVRGEISVNTFGWPVAVVSSTETATLAIVDRDGSPTTITRCG